MRVKVLIKHCLLHGWVIFQKCMVGALSRMCNGKKFKNKKKHKGKKRSEGEEKVERNSDLNHLEQRICKK